jgi:uncharacterized membrane protein (DUF4010 family)
VSFDAIAGLVVATLGGAAIGLERQWSGHASGPHARFGGIRTFTLLGALGGLAGWFVERGSTPLAAVLLGAAAAVVVAGYVAASRHDVDATSEIAALVVLAAGTLAGAGYLAAASAVVAATALLLVEKTRLHALVMRIDDASLRASARFAAMACIILPLLPSGPYGPLDAVRPRELWALVLFFSGLSFAGWIARRLVGPHQGAIVAGLIGGVISSTSVTLRFAQDSRPADAPRLALAAGAVGASTVMLLRVTLASAVLNAPLALAVAPLIAPAFALGAVIVIAAWRAGRAGAAREPVNGSPLQLSSALQMTALFQLVLFVILAVQARWGSQALVATSAFVGLTDLDALTLSLARGAAAASDLRPVALSLVAGIVANTLLKLSVAVVVGRGLFRAVTLAALAAMVVATAAMTLLTRGG